MSRARARGVLAALLAIAAGCASPSRPYPGPPPSETAPARLTVVYSDVPPPGAALRSVALHVYDLGSACFSEDHLEAAYLGVVDVSLGSREIHVPAGSFVLFRIRLNAFEGTASVSCTVSGGFVPEPGHAYEMEFSALTTQTCVMSANDEAGREVALGVPRVCQP